MQRLIKYISSVSRFLCALALVGCGVKGPPIPPSPPAYLGRGTPNYQDQNPEQKANPQKKPKGTTQNPESPSQNE